LDNVYSHDIVAKELEHPAGRGQNDSKTDRSCQTNISSVSFRNWALPTTSVNYALFTPICLFRSAEEVSVMGAMGTISRVVRKKEIAFRESHIQGDGPGH